MLRLGFSDVVKLSLVAFALKAIHQASPRKPLWLGIHMYQLNNKEKVKWAARSSLLPGYRCNATSYGHTVPTWMDWTLKRGTRINPSFLTLLSSGNFVTALGKITNILSNWPPKTFGYSVILIPQGIRMECCLPVRTTGGHVCSGPCAKESTPAAGLTWSSLAPHLG